MIPRRKNKVTPPPDNCPLGECLSIIGGAWTPNIIWFLSTQSRRFSELKHDLEGVSSKVLTQRLKMLVEEGVVVRQVIDTSPPTVEYSLTELGKELKPAVEAIVEVGKKLKAMKA